MSPPPNTDPRIAAQAAMAYLQRRAPHLAVPLLQQALRKHPADPALNQVMALSLSQLGQSDRALYFIDRAIAAQPRFADFHLTRGAIKTNTPDLAGAIASFREALRLDPTHQGATAMLGMALVQQGQHAEAGALLERAIAHSPARTDLAIAYARTLGDTGRADEALAAIERTLSRAGPSPEALSVACMISNYTDIPLARSLEFHRSYGRSLGAMMTPPPAPADDEDPERPLRIGYLSPDLRTHSVASFLEPILRAHDRARYPAICFHIGDAVDKTTARLRSLASGFHQLSAFTTPDALAQTIRSERIDILIELSGHSSGHRLPLLARRLAPVQATFIGYPNTTGVPNIDYRIVDVTTDPMSDVGSRMSDVKGGDAAQSLATERLLRLPGCFLCYTPLPDAPEPVTSDIRHPTSEIVFGSFNNPAKISAATISLWSRTLQAVPGSRLLLKGKVFREPTIRARYTQAFEHAGLDPARLRLISEVPTRTEHLALYTEVDIALDTFPYNGTTTTCEALWMGVPVVTLAGDRHTSRVGLSLLTAAGFPQWAVRTPEAFPAIAASLASDPQSLADLRRTLRPHLLASPLLDAETYTGSLQALLREVWRMRAEPRPA